MRVTLLAYTTQLQVISNPLHVRAEFRDGYWALAVIWTVSLLLSVPWAVFHTVRPVSQWLDSWEVVTDVTCR